MLLKQHFPLLAENRPVNKQSFPSPALIPLLSKNLFHNFPVINKMVMLQLGFQAGKERQTHPGYKITNADDRTKNGSNEDRVMH